MVTERQNEILNLVVDIFTKTREPVGSKHCKMSFNPVVRRSETIWLPSKTRVTRKRLTLEWPKCPAGLGFQYFVQNSLDLELIDEQDVYQVVKAFDFEAFKLDDIWMLQLSCWPR